jgi:flagellar hook-associated protein 2
VTLTLSRDTSSINKALEKFVSAYNEYNTLVRDLGGYNASTEKAGTLLGDSALRGADGKMRSMLSSVPAELAGMDKKTLSDIGISIQKDGSLKLDSAKLDKALAADFAGVAKVAAGYGRSMDGIITGLIGSDGMITGKTTGLQDSITGIGKQRQTLERRLESIEARYKAQFTALDTLVSGMMQTSNYLEQQLESLANLNKK